MRRGQILTVWAILALALAQVAPLPAAWAPVEGKIMTRWAKDVTPDKALPEYPRPQMARKQWQNLNGLWDYAIVARDAGAKDAARPDSFQGQILVPYPVQSALSGVGKTLTPEQSLWYKRTFTVPSDWKGQRVLLHFGAVDWQATVWVNGNKLGEHQGGYDPFSFDITAALKPGAEQEIVVAVWDPNDRSSATIPPIPHGKQVLRPSRIMYTAVSGIWQTAWLEPVGKAAIGSLKITPDVDNGQVKIAVAGDGTAEADTVTVQVLSMGTRVAQAEGKVGGELSVKLPKLELWSPASPFLYDLKVTLARDGKALDEVASYFGMRKIEIKKDEAGVNRMFLNGKALFQYGPLDQGWWPDGLYTAPTDEALKFDIDETLKMGFNMARKHVKVEPERWYYWADKLGLLVWQDMPSGDRGIGGNQPDLVRTPESAAIYEREWKAEIASHYNHPSIIMWVPFNEGWGQFDTARIVELTKKLDPTRLVDCASGWSDRGVGDVHDMHSYPGPGMFPLEDKRASVLGEFGGLGLPTKEHLWIDTGAWGYRNMTDPADLTRRYGSLINALKAYAACGLSAAVYTQTTDCETEVNGLLTYDRAINKIGTEAIAKINKEVYGIKTDLTAAIPKVDMPTPTPRPARTARRGQTTPAPAAKKQ